MTKVEEDQLQRYGSKEVLGERGFVNIKIPENTRYWALCRLGFQLSQTRQVFFFFGLSCAFIREEDEKK